MMTSLVFGDSDSSLHFVGIFEKRMEKKMDIKNKFYKHMINVHGDAMKWYKRKLALSEDINIEDIKEEEIENVEILTENK